MKLRPSIVNIKLLKKLTKHGKSNEANKNFVIQHHNVKEIIRRVSSAATSTVLRRAVNVVKRSATHHRGRPSVKQPATLSYPKAHFTTKLQSYGRVQCNTLREIRLTVAINRWCWHQDAGRQRPLDTSCWQCMARRGQTVAPRILRYTVASYQQAHMTSSTDIYTYKVQNSTAVTA
jgi:hypothetical protein